MSKKDNPGKKISLRKCVGCQRIFERTSLLKIMIENPSENLVIEPENKHYGRSAYICKTEECLKNALKKNKISKALKKRLSDMDLEKIRSYFKTS